MFCFAKCCRFCLRQNETLLNYKLCDNNEISLWKKIMNISSELINDSLDVYPKWICSDCQIQLHLTYKFVQNCLKSQQLLQNYSLKLNSTNIQVNEECNLKILLFQLTDQMIKDIREKVKHEDTIIDGKMDFDLIGSEMSDVYSNNIVKHELPLVDAKVSIRDTASNCENFIDINRFNNTSPTTVTNAIIKKEPVLSFTDESIVLTENLIVSQRKRHLRQSMYACDVCNKKFNIRKNLHKHKKIHNLDPQTVEKRYSCGTCYKKFNKKSHLVEHVRIHTGEKPYLCGICNKKFTRQGHLTEHIRTHTGKTPFSCIICNKKFFKRSYLVTHIRTHTGEKPFSCDVCKKKFSCQAYLTKHRKTHIEEKPYLCDICNWKFTRKEHLVVHIRTHTGEKPFLCDICNKKFSRQQNVIRHRKTHFEK